MEMKIKRLRENAIIPQRATPGSAGYDLCACLSAPEEILPGQTKMIPTGIAIALPEQTAAFIYARSGLATKKGIAPANCVGVVDSDYRGENMVPLHNDSGEPQVIRHGDRVAQMVVLPYLAVDFLEAEELDETERGEGGFGSTGR